VARYSLPSHGDKLMYLGSRLGGVSEGASPRGRKIMEPELEAIGYSANFTTVALKILVGCLEKNGALMPGQVQTALRQTVEHPQAKTDRLDYQFLAQLLKALDDSVEQLH
jgi:hypothetical protein